MMKGIIRRSRPSYNKGMHLVVSVDHYSFPSGHSSRAFLIVLFAFEYAHQWKVDVFSKVGTYVGPNIDQGLVYYALCCALVIWVLATASSRVLLGRHYLVDVVVGSVVGVLEALFVTRVLLHLPIFNETQISRLLEFTHFLWQEALSRLTG
jgi:membrane-associated phospholipid phosphatase